MHSYQQAFYELKEALNALYDANEATAITHALLEHITGRSKLQRLLEKDTCFDDNQERQYIEAKEKLLKGFPLQYTTGVQWFDNLPFYVNEHVLIPRPETEELVDWIVEDWKHEKELAIIDIGTGSGNIPISIKLKMPDAYVFGCDLSNEALKVARINAKSFNAVVDLFEFDMAKETSWEQLKLYDVIVSNPPYIPMEEKEIIDSNVKEFEPNMALFAPENDPFFFYKMIAENGKAHLKKGGVIYCEFHRDFGKETKAVFENCGYTVMLRKDMHGNDRMLKAYFS